MNSGPLSGSERRLLLVLPKGVGDVVYGLALAVALHDQFPGLEIHWAVYPGPSPLLWQQAAVQRALPYSPNAKSLWQLRQRTRGIVYDVLLNLGMYLHALPPTLICRAKRTFCLGTAYAKDRLQWFHDEAIPVRANARVLDVFMAAGARLGLEGSSPRWSWGFTPAERAARDDFFKPAGERPRVVLLPCTGRADKDWPSARWAELAVRLHTELGAFVVLAGGPSESARRAAAGIAAALPDVRMAVGDDLRRMLWTLSGSDLVVGGDTGPLHMARALEVPLVGLYGHTDPQRYAPPAPFPGEILDRYHFDSPGRPSAWRGTGGRSARMELISVDEVAEASRRLLNDPATRAGSRRESGA